MTETTAEPPNEQATEVTSKIEGAGPTPNEAMTLLRDVEVELTLEIGRRAMRIADVARLGPGATLELDKLAGEPLELFVNGTLIGRGEATVVGDRYAIRITEIVRGERRNP